MDWVGLIGNVLGGVGDAVSSAKEALARIKAASIVMAGATAVNMALSVAILVLILKRK